ncbi:MAG: hypothetical protein KKE49_01530, partial [Proteobacteria bacterium]|nr:hypothetical protein [Pseudomonadota bacterium]
IFSGRFKVTVATLSDFSKRIVVNCISDLLSIVVWRENHRLLRRLRVFSSVWLDTFFTLGTAHGSSFYLRLC